MNNCRLTSIFAISISCLSLSAPTASATTGPVVQVHALDTPIVLDGDATDWLGIPAVEIALKPTESGLSASVPSVKVKAGIHGEHVSMYFEWADSTEDTMHKPWQWDDQKERYVKGPQREDRLAVQFRIDGDYTTNWLSGQEFTADMWHWKSSRSNPLNIVHDKSTKVSRKKLLRSYSTIAPDGEKMYIARPGDEGDKLYKTTRYVDKELPIMPKYLLLDRAPEGSVADVEAKGVWRHGKWHLEVRRRLDTQHDDDVKFSVGSAIAGGIAIFNQSDNNEHTVSDVITFQF